MGGSRLPGGTVTLLFTDIEGSTRLIEELGEDGYAGALSQHRRALREAFAGHGGVEVDTQGDAFLYAFVDPAAALAAAATGQAALGSGPVKVRMGLHTGVPRLTGEGYAGRELHRAARIASSGHGGQVVVSAATRGLVDGSELVELGEHRLKDFDEPVPLFQLGRERFPPLKTISNTNLPRPVSSFVGRERERQELVAMLSDGARLLTLRGPGGSGKTRLAVEVASELVPSFSAGVFWIGLSALRDPTLVSDAVAQTLGAKDGVAEHVGDRKLLLLLDNFEQVVDAAPALRELLESCPNLKILVTSRELLRIDGEVDYAVPPLAETEAVELFCARSQLEPDETIAELCRRLDDLPLALELAAARTNVLSPAQILERLSQRLDLLRGGRDTEARQQTLRATIEWSYDLLTAAEQTMFARLGAFAGGCRLDAIEAVCDPDGGLGLDVLEGISSLLDKSLLRRRDDPDGQPRYWMLETIREYAAGIGGADEPQIREAHAGFFAQFADIAVATLREEQREWSDRLEADRGNLRVAVAWAITEGAADIALRLAIGYGRLCALRGPISEGRRVLAAAIDIADAAPAALRQKALMGLGDFAERQNDVDAARRYASESVELARDAGDEQALAGSLLLLGLIEADAGNLVPAEQLQREALRLFSELGSDANVRMTLGMLGFLLIVQARLPEAEEVCERALHLSRVANDKRGIVVGAGNLGHVRASLGDVPGALCLLREAFVLSNELSDVHWVAEVLTDISRVALAVGDLDTAATLVGAVSQLEETAQFELTAAYRAWFDEIVAQVGDRKGAGAAALAFERGARLNEDELVERTLGFIDRHLAVNPSRDGDGAPLIPATDS